MYFPSRHISRRFTMMSKQRNHVHRCKMHFRVIIYKRHDAFRPQIRLFEACLAFEY